MSIFKFFTRRQSETLTDNFASGGYLEYVALLTQTGTSAPVATVLNDSAPNYLGTIVWTRNNVGDYTSTLANAFTSKTFIEPNYLVFYDGDIRRVEIKKLTTSTIAIVNNSNIIDMGEWLSGSTANPLRFSVKVYN